MAGEGWGEGLIVFACAAMVGAYHFWYFQMIKKNPTGTVYGMGKQIRQEFVAKIMSEDKYAILGVQTMRNELMVGQFLAQASFVALSLVVGAASSTDLPRRLESIGKKDPIIGSMENMASAPVLKLAFLTILLGSVFVNSVQHLRLVRHVSMYMGLRVPGRTEEEKKGLEKRVSIMYERSSISIWYAMRCMNLLFPAIAWLFGATYMLLGGVGSIFFMAIVDNLHMSDEIMHLGEGVASLPRRLRRHSHSESKTRNSIHLEVRPGWGTKDSPSAGSSPAGGDVPSPP
eukprot:CAMPEP_0173390596 /NCGR_PEP_ID=MMETSP1356-20130122/15431_1 /TAXON_ID=77927 ORGANISM="Hemiselmis virescens, Strain PCC157" /NCGR_SAMPLE_ID=MMETSP1356 /ASSEMBLY_ACC=CAM_ASM_000847 /LENGTH=286 /DNA_ID=CAMNT_0014348029 /DNA_START=20 /DNA_END=877 /DNA_ORIENTATION=+